MKRFYLLSVWAMMLIMPVYASASEFFVKISRAGNYRVQFADQWAMTPSNTFRFFDLNPGTYTLTVMDAVSNYTYYQVNVTLTYGYRSVGEIDAYGIYRNVASLPVSYTVWYQEAPQVITYPNNPYPNNPYPNPYPNNPYDPCPNPYPNNPFPNTPYPGGYFGAMDNNSFNDLKTMVTQKSWDSDRLAILNQTMATNYFSSDQVLALAQTFSWDSDRLTFAKSAYSRCIDKNNYFKVFNAFKWSSDIDELQRYIDSQQ